MSENQVNLFDFIDVLWQTGFNHPKGSNDTAPCKNYRVRKIWDPFCIVKKHISKKRVCRIQWSRL